MTEYPPPTNPLQGAMSPLPSSASEDVPVTERASDAAQSAKDGGADLAQTAGEKVKDVGAEADRQARDLLGEAREQVRQQAGSQHRSLVESMRSLSDELDAMTTRNEQPGIATEVVSQARDRVHDVADWLDKRGPGDLLDEVRSLARRRPGAFLVGAALAGVVAGRLTRGAVAVHSDDAAAAAAPTGPGLTAHPLPASTHRGEIPR